MRVKAMLRYADFAIDRVESSRVESMCWERTRIESLDHQTASTATRTQAGSLHFLPLDEQWL